MNIIFLTGLFPDNLKEQIQTDSKKTIQYAANALQWNYVKGLDFYGSTTLINLPYVGSYPFLYKKICLPTVPFQHTSKSNDISLGFLNLPLLKNIHRYNKAKKQLIKTLKSNINNEEVVVIGYALTSPFTMAIAHAKKKYPNIKTCLIIPDLPHYMSDSKNIFYLLLKKVDSFFIQKGLRNIDSFVLLSKYMADYFKHLEKPWVVVEAIYNEKETPNTKIEKENYTVFYSGTLARRYGIFNLLEAFRQIKDPNYRLWLCGEGDTKSDILNAAELDNRIRYWGQIPREKVLELQSQSTVLVNPRTSEGEYTKYSFPSKTVEYMASGTPCILYELKGIPKEYLDYCYSIKEETVDALRDKIIEVCSFDEAARISFAQKAKDFILQNKNPQVQCKKVVDMLSKI